LIGIKVDSKGEEIREVLVTLAGDVKDKYTKPGTTQKVRLDDLKREISKYYTTHGKFTSNDPWPRKVVISYE
jgi:hypothetical protein